MPTNTSPDRRRDQMKRAFAKRVDAMPDGTLPAASAIDEYVDHMVELSPRTMTGRASEAIGPVYSTRALMAMWSISREAVSKRARQGKLLVLPVEGQNLFPVFQFTRGQVRDDVLSVVEVLRPAVDPFTIAHWLNTPLADDEQGRTPLEVLDAGGREQVIADAQQRAAQWAA